MLVWIDGSRARRQPPEELQTDFSLLGRLENGPSRDLPMECSCREPEGREKWTQSTKVHRSSAMGLCSRSDTDDLSAVIHSLLVYRIHRAGMVELLGRPERTPDLGAGKGGTVGIDWRQTSARSRNGQIRTGACFVTSPPRQFRAWDGSPSPQSPLPNMLVQIRFPAALDRGSAAS